MYKIEPLVPSSSSRSGDPNYVEGNGGVFRTREKFYSGKNFDAIRSHKIQKPVEPDFSQVFDFSNLENNVSGNINRIKSLTIKISKDRQFNYFDPEKVSAYSIEGINGFYFIPNPFNSDQQRYWVRRCVQDYSLNTPTNLSNLSRITEGKCEYFTTWKLENMKELRWASLGYHFQWTPRIYTEEHRGHFPKDLSQYIQDVASLFGHDDMIPEATIINYYPHSKCMMGGHLDDAEESDKPIVSTSFGNTVIFLIGGRTRDFEPVAVYVRSGDIVIMDKDARYSYHGVPKMIQNTSPEIFQTVDENWSQDLANYLKNSRININSRQVRCNPIPYKEDNLDFPHK